jgi:hypothetical protein
MFFMCGRNLILNDIYKKFVIQREKFEKNYHRDQCNFATKKKKGRLLSSDVWRHVRIYLCTNVSRGPRIVGKYCEL